MLTHFDRRCPSVSRRESRHQQLRQHSGCLYISVLVHGCAVECRHRPPLLRPKLSVLLCHHHGRRFVGLETMSPTTLVRLGDRLWERSEGDHQSIFFTCYTCFVSILPSRFPNSPSLLTELLSDVPTFFYLVFCLHFYYTLSLIFKNIYIFQLFHSVIYWSL